MKWCSDTVDSVWRAGDEPVLWAGSSVITCPKHKPLLPWSSQPHQPDRNMLHIEVRQGSSFTQFLNWGCNFSSPLWDLSSPISVCYIVSLALAVLVCFLLLGIVVRLGVKTQILVLQFASSVMGRWTLQASAASPQKWAPKWLHLWVFLRVKCDHGYEVLSVIPFKHACLTLFL